MKLTWQIVRFDLKETFSISYGNYQYRDGLVLCLSHHNYKGYGECIAIDYYKIDLHSYIQILEKHKQIIEKQTIETPEVFYYFLENLGLPSFLRSALDCAYWDLFGKLENKSFLEINNFNYNILPESTLTISAGDIEGQLSKMNASKWNRFKVKCSAFDLKNIQKLALYQKSIAIDANGSFSKEDCLWLENGTLGDSFLYIEQPMSPGIDNFWSLNSIQSINWMADEEVQEDTNLVLLQNHYTSINIKLPKCGGITPALKLIANAKSLGFKTMIGCMTESTVSISAAAVLTPLVDFADLDGANLIQNDIAKGSSIFEGKVQLSEKPGLGIQLL